MSSAAGAGSAGKADRAAALTQHLLAFSRKQNLQPVALDLNAVVASLGPMLRRLIGEHIEIALAPGTALGIITADAGQMEQVLVNLVVNARDAMPLGGRIRVETENVEISDSREYERVSGIPCGTFVKLTVSDTGHGISLEHRERIFEPFFTTKEVGKGTGLGLSTVFGIVKQSRGHVLLESEIGRGTIFRIYFPCTAQPGLPTPRSLEVVPEMGGTETVLVVEDEDALRGLARRILEKRGYDVLTARNGNDATSLAATHRGTIHLLLTDVIMPGVGGVELSRRIRLQCPGIRVLYMSGYANDDIDRGGALTDGAVLLAKPFTGADLALAVRAVLDAPAPHPACARGP